MLDSKYSAIDYVLEANRPARPGHRVRLVPQPHLIGQEDVPTQTIDNLRARVAHDTAGDRGPNGRPVEHPYRPVPIRLRLGAKTNADFGVIKSGDR